MLREVKEEKYNPTKPCFASQSAADACTPFDAKSLRRSRNFNLGLKRGYLREDPIARLDFRELVKAEVEEFTPKRVEKMLNYALEQDLALLPFLVLGLRRPPSGRSGKTHLGECSSYRQARGGNSGECVQDETSPLC